MIHQILKVLGIIAPAIDPKESYVRVITDYERLTIALANVGSKELHITASSASLGSIPSYADSLMGLLKSLMEVNATLKERVHVETGLFFTVRMKDVKLDDFLFVHNGYYVKDVTTQIMQVIDQIEIYCELMKGADSATYGVMEHNHRQLFAYTRSLTVFLEAIFNHFGQ